MNRGLTTNLKKLRKQLIKGDQKIAAERVGCHIMTVQQALNGEPGPKREAVIDTLLQIIEERNSKRNKLKQL